MPPGFGMPPAASPSPGVAAAIPTPVRPSPPTPGYPTSAPPSYSIASVPNPEAEPFSDQPSLRLLESRYIAYLLQHTEGNRSACARILGIGRNTLARKIKEYDLGHL